MRHYVVVFLESRLFPGTWVTDHFVRKEDREDVPEFPGGPFAPAGVQTDTHKQMLERLRAWQNENAPNPSWTLEECVLGNVALFTVLWYSRDPESSARRVVQYVLMPVQVRSL